MVICKKARQKIINGLPLNIRVPLQGLHKASQGSIIEEFLSEADVALTACDVVLRKADKKKDKTIPIQQRHVLIEQLNAAQDAALVLHVAVLLLFHTVTQTVLNASGRFVPYIISFLQSHLPQSIGELLSELQGNSIYIYHAFYQTNVGLTSILCLSRFGHSRTNKQRG